MTSCLAVSDTTIALSSIDVDKCFVCALDTGNVKNLTEHLGKSYHDMPLNNRDLQKACAAFSADGKSFAYNTNKCKLLSVWNTANWSLIENMALSKHATNIVFTPKTNAIIVGDKKGDVYAFGKRPVRVLGHSSMVLGIGFTDDEKFIITSDSDEKVRVSLYPNGKVIKYYMMGHEAYVSSICTFNNFLLSGSGDCTLCLWDLNNGDLVDKFFVTSPIQSVVKINDVAAVQLYDSNELYFVKTEIKENNCHSIKHIKKLILENNVLNLAACSNQLWITMSNTVYNFTVGSNEDDIITINDYTQIQQTLENLVKSFVYLENTNLMIYLFKKMIDKQKRAEQNM